MADTLAFAIASNVLPTGFVGIVNRFDSHYSYEKTEKEITGNPPNVIETKVTNKKWKREMTVTAAFSSKPDAQAIINMLGSSTQVTATVTSLDPAVAFVETITGTLVDARITGTKDEWWEVTLTIEAKMSQTP